MKEPEVEMSDIASDYIKIGDSIVQRALGAYERHSSFESILDGFAKLHEEFNEVTVECKDHLIAESDMERFELCQRIASEARDVAVVALRLCHLAESKVKG